MKLRLALGSFAMIAAMTVAPMASQAGGLRDRSHCPLNMLMRLHHVAPVAAAPAKKQAPKAVKVAKAAAKPMK